MHVVNGLITVGFALCICASIGFGWWARGRFERLKPRG